MNYELGKQKIPYSHWQAIDKGEKSILPYDYSNPIMQVLKTYWLREQ